MVSLHVLDVYCDRLHHMYTSRDLFSATAAKFTWFELSRVHSSIIAGFPGSGFETRLKSEYRIMRGPPTYGSSLYSRTPPRKGTSSSWDKAWN